MTSLRRTAFQQHVDRWSDCSLCLLCSRRKRVVIGRGKLPCQVLFIGEAPGASEDVVGIPFCGPAGKLLDQIIARTQESVPYSYAITNLVGCIPKADGNDKGEPPKEAILACQPRLLEFVDLCKPEIIVCVGSLSQKWVPEIDGVHRVPIVHPAAILRMDVSQQSLAIKRCVVTVADLVYWARNRV